MPSHECIELSHIRNSAVEGCKTRERTALGTSVGSTFSRVLSMFSGETSMYFMNSANVQRLPAALPLHPGATLLPAVSKV